MCRVQAPSLGPVEEQDIPSQEDEGTARQTDLYEQQQKQLQELQQQLLLVKEQQQPIWLKYFALVVVVLLAYVWGKMS